MKLDFRSKAIIAAIVLVVSLFGQGYLGASSWAPREGCSHLVTENDTLFGIQEWSGVSMHDIAANTPMIDPNNLDHIERGWLIDICEPTLDMRINRGLAPAIGDNQPTNAATPDEINGTRIPGLATEWGLALRETQPDWADDSDLRFGTFIAGPESAFCTHTVNESDANPPVWGPSVGCIQVRTFLRSSDLALEPWRDRAKLEDPNTGFHFQAEAFWQILSMQGRRAWGPVTNGIAPGGTCAGSSRPSQCAEWSAVADAVLSFVKVEVPR